ncbi:MAG: hypothetical protein U0796_20770 [Gemmatales bacterium]
MINIGVAAFVDDINFVPVFVHPLDGNRNGQTAMREQYDLMKRLLPLPEGLLMTSDRGTFSAEHVARLHRDGRHVLCAVPWNDYQKLYDQRRIATVEAGQLSVAGTAAPPRLSVVAGEGSLRTGGDRP